jgi:NAD(P)-dependent dehydrogenase (short-subunit alcohol dehydrogenase family)
VVADSTDLGALDAAMIHIGKRFGQIDVLFANAGQGYFATIEDISEADFDAAIRSTSRVCFSPFRKHCL